MAFTNSTVGPFLEAVRSGTSNAHAQLEETLGLDRITRSRDEYLRTLQLFWGIWDPLERMLVESPVENESKLDLRQRLRASLLVDDLAEIAKDGHLISDIPQATLPWKQLSLSEAAGILYVLEGSRLGGKLISRTLREKLGITATTGGSFFASGDADPVELWRSFVRWAEETVREEEISEAARIAKQTFDVMNHWFSSGVAK